MVVTTRAQKGSGAEGLERKVVWRKAGVLTRFSVVLDRRGRRIAREFFFLLLAGVRSCDRAQVVSSTRAILGEASRVLGQSGALKVTSAVARI